MKKLLAIFTVAAVMTACNDAAESKTTETPKTDTSNPAADAQKAAESVDAKLDTLNNKGQAAMDTIKDGAKKVMEGVKEGVKAGANKVAEGAKEAGKEVKEAATKTVEKVKDAVKH
jgi:hypothetical protein